MNWVLLRGLGREKRHWYKFIEKMQSAFPTAEILPLNLPGIESTKNIPTDIKSMTDDVRAQWLQYKGDKPWNILSISLGGMIAIDWCHRYPQDFNHLVTINTSSKTTSPTFKRISLDAIKTISQSLITKDIKKRERAVLKLTTNQIDITDEVLDYWVAIAKETKLNRINLIKQLFAASKFDLPENLNLPYTLLASKADRFCHYSCSEKIARRFNANLVLHDKGGHDLSTDAPEWIIEQLKNI